MRQGNLANVLLAVAVVILIIAVGGCGGGSNASSSSSPDSGSKESPTNQSKVASSDPSTEPSAEFVQPGNSGVAQFVQFGKEASAAEREAASAVLTENLVARAAADFAKQCATLDRNTLSSLGASEKKGKAAIDACITSLAALSQPLKKSAKARANLLKGPISAFRVKGDSGYALYHGTDKNNYAMLMTKDGGGWKVGSILSVDLGCPPGALDCVPASAPSAPK